jgi:hypothetical protein
VFKERGVKKIAPHRMVWAIRKADLYDLAERQKWPKPYAPFMIQVCHSLVWDNKADLCEFEFDSDRLVFAFFTCEKTRPPELTPDELKARGGFRRAGVFVMFSNWQVALLSRLFLWAGLSWGFCHVLKLACCSFISFVFVSWSKLGFLSCSQTGMLLFYLVCFCELV